MGRTPEPGSPAFPVVDSFDRPSIKSIRRNGSCRGDVDGLGIVGASKLEAPAAGRSASELDELFFGAD